MLPNEKHLKPSERTHYVNNKQLYEAYCNWHKSIIDAKNDGKDEPPIPNFIAESIMKIAHRLSYRPNFINYSYREDMVGDAIMNCIKTAKNFNPAKSENPFSFITTIANNSFIARINKEKKESYVKGKLIQSLPVEELMNIDDSDQDTGQIHAQFIEYLRENNYMIQESPLEKKKKKKEEIKLHEEESLEGFMEEEPKEDKPE